MSTWNSITGSKVATVTAHRLAESEECSISASGLAVAQSGSELLVWLVFGNRFAGQILSFANSQHGVTGAGSTDNCLSCEFKRTYSSEPQAEGSRS